MAISFLVVLTAFGIGEAADYYASPSGAGTACSKRSPCSAQTAIGKAAIAGDTVWFKDGTYTGVSGMLVISAKEGAAAKNTTFKAVNDGQVLFDGQNSNVPCDISGNSSYVTIEGIRCGNSSGDAFYIHGSGTHHITVKRVSAFNAANNNNHIFSVWNSHHITMEDVAAYGNGRQSYNLLGSDHVTMRRCYGLWQSYTGSGGPVGFMQIYGSSYAIVENCAGAWGGTSGMEGRQGLVIWANTYNAGANHNKIYGNVMMNYPAWAYGVSSAQNTITGNEFHHNAAIDCGNGFQQTADNNLAVENLVVKGAADNGFFVSTDRSYTSNYNKYNPSFAIKTARLKHSVFVGNVRGLGWDRSAYGFAGMTNTYNAYYGNVSNHYMNASTGAGEKRINPNYDTNAYGKGAYLMVPSALRGRGERGADIGSEVLYRYQGGVLTNVPLWPWPMEDRIFRETGVSVTWEANGGLWKTLKGVYGSR